MSRQLPSDIHLNRYMFPTRWRLHTDMTMRSSCDIEASSFHLMLKYAVLNGHRFSVIHDLRTVCLREAVIPNGLQFPFHSRLHSTTILIALVDILQAMVICSFSSAPARPVLRSLLEQKSK